MGKIHIRKVDVGELDMAITEFGKLVRKARVDAEVNMSEMASGLGVTPAFLSGLETGRKNISPEWVGRISAYFQSLGVELRGLAEAADVTNQHVSLEGLPLQQQMMISGFARSSMDAETLEKFRQLLATARRDGGV